MKTLKTILLGITAATLIAGCDSGGGGSDKTKPPVNNPPVISSVVCPAEINESEQGVCQINAYDSEGSLLSYSVDKDWNYNFDANGKGTFIAPEVPSDTNYDLEFEVCDDKNACTTASTSILVKNVEEPPIDPPEENVLPVIQGLAFPQDSTASADANNIYQTWGKDIDGRVVATDGNGDALTYGAVVSGGDAYLNWINGDEFSIAMPQQTSTDATADLGQVVMEACDDEACDTKTFKAVGKNPITANIYPTFYENGIVEWDSDATSDGSYLSSVQGWMNGVDMGTLAIGDTFTDSVFMGDYIIDGVNTGKFSWLNDAGDQRDVVGGFTPASESEWRTIMRERLADWGFVEGVGSYLEENIIAVDGNDNPGCTIPSGTTEYITPDFTIFSNGNLATANYTSPTDNKTTDLEDYNKLKYCGNINNDLQMTMYPAYEIYNRIDEFHDLGFTFEE